MTNIAVTIGNTTAEDFADWLTNSELGVGGLGASIQEQLGFWEGRREPSITVTFFNRTPYFVDKLLKEYGADHPGERAFGVFTAPQSQLYMNPVHAIAGDTFPEEWAS